MLSIRPSQIAKILVQDQLIVHVIIGIPLIVMMFTAWQVPLDAYWKIAILYTLLITCCYLPLTWVFSHSLLRPLIGLKPTSSKITITDIMHVINLTASISKRFRITYPIILYTGYLITAYLLNQGIIADLMPNMMGVTASLLIFGSVVCLCQTLLDNLRIAQHFSDYIQDYINRVTLEYPQSLLRHRTTSLQEVIQNILIITNIISLSILGIYFCVVLFINEPANLLNGMIFTIVILVAASIFLSVLSTHIFQTIAQPLKATEDWLKNVTMARTGQNIPYATYAELVPTLRHINDLREQINKKTKSLEDERDNLQNILKRINDGVVVMRQSGAILYINTAAKHILDIDTTLRTIRMSGKMIFRPVENQKDTTITSWQSLLSNNIKNIRTYMYTGEGAKRLLVLSTERLISQDESPVYLITFSDITKDAELEQMKADFVSIAAHELRTPLTSVRNYLSLLEEESAEKLDEDSRLYLVRTRTSAEQLAEIVESFLTASRIERNVIELHKSTFDWSTMIKDLTAKFKPLADQKGLALILDMPNEKIELTADADRLQEIVGNLIDNAIKYCYKGEVKVSTKADKMANTVYIDVKDSGIGIPSQEINKLFTKFYRASNANQSEIKGTGIGLYVVKTLIELHKGKIWIESEENKGTTFHISMPMS